MLQTNIAALMHFTRTFAPPMVARNRGHIINISSIAAHEVYSGESQCYNPGHNIYLLGPDAGCRIYWEMPSFAPMATKALQFSFCILGYNYRFIITDYI